MNAASFKAGYLPGLHDAEVMWHRWHVGPLQVDLPRLSDAQMTALAHRVQQASRSHLKTMSVSDIVRVLDQATARLLDPRDP